MLYKKAINYFFPFSSIGNIAQLLKFAEAFYPLDFLINKIIEHIRSYLAEADGLIEIILIRLIDWLEANALGQFKSYKTLQRELMQTKPDPDNPFLARGVENFLLSLIPYKYFETVPSSQIETSIEIVKIIYLDALEKVFSLALESPALSPEQLFDIDEDLKKQLTQDESKVTPWLRSIENI